MKTIIKTSLLVCCALLLAGCTADEIETDKKTKTPDIPEGATLFESFAQPETRTVVGGCAPGMSLNLLWNAYDVIWAKTSSAPTGWVRNSYSNLYGTRTSNEVVFGFNDRLTEDSYLVRYTGEGGEGFSYDKVTIPSEQRKIGIQNDPYYFFLHGDCGVAVARKDKLTGRYKFQLEHKAAYIGIAPHSSNYSMIVRKYSPKFWVKSIKVTADQAICGTFNFNDDGIDLTSRPAATEQNKSITTSGCLMPDKFDRIGELENASVIVLAPGTYGTVKVEYVVGTDEDPYVTVTREYKNVTFTAGKVKWMRPDFRAELCFKTYLDDRRVKKCPNVNELRWLIEKGDPHIGKFYYSPGINSEGGLSAAFSRGIWIKKLSVIAKENGKTVEQLKAAAPDGANYEVKGGAPKTITDLPSDLPNNMGDYLFLPATSWYGDDYFWSSSYYPENDPKYCYGLYLNVDRGIIEVFETRNEGKKIYWRLWPGTVEE
jgi:putative lipoprotein